MTYKELKNENLVLKQYNTELRQQLADITKKNKILNLEIKHLKDLITELNYNKNIQKNKIIQLSKEIKALDTYILNYRRK